MNKLLLKASYLKLDSLAVIFAIYGGGHGEVLNTATPQKNLTNTASPQEKSTEHRHRNSYFYLHNFNVFIWRNTFIPKQLSTK